MMVAGLAILVLIIDIAAITDLLMSTEPSYVLEIGFLVLSVIFFASLPLIYKKLKKQDEKKKKKGARF
jgi:cephalosporin hydroxylase